MRVRFDPDADALYIRLAETEIDESEEVRPGIVLDYDVDGRVIGIEVLGVQQCLPDARPAITEMEVATAAAE
jgi:uncharacterized protein YuzE